MMNTKKYQDFLKILENELLSYRWGCVYDSEKKVTLAEYGNAPTENSSALPEQCNALFESSLQSKGSGCELMAHDEQWILLMRRFTKGSLRCFILLRSGGITTGWARDTLKDKLQEFSSN
ncbi:MAG: hypothetical protein WCW40_11480 [Bacteroidota bacterium]